jgi:hypothetical protein
MGPATNDATTPIVNCAKNAGTDLPKEIIRSMKGAMMPVPTHPIIIIVTRLNLSLNHPIETEGIE